MIYDTTVNNLPVEGTTEESSAETQSGGHNRITCPGQGPGGKKGNSYDTERDGPDAGPRPGQQEGENIRVLEINNVTTLADYFVLCTGTSAPQLKALADAGEKAMKEAGILPHHIEGHRGGTWILQDYGDVVVHLFDTEARAFYDLDRLWQDAVEVDLVAILQPEG